MRFRKSLHFLLVLFVVGGVFAAADMAAHTLAVQDISQYWAAAHLVSQNPYSLELTREFEHSAGIFTNLPATKVPPWAIMPVMPLGLLGYYSSFALWSLMSIIVISSCARAVWRRSGAGPSLAPAILSLIFGPTIVLLMLGQFTVLVLLGAILFCFFIERGRDWLAGISLLLVLGKPHVTLLFLLAIALWMVYSKRWIVLVSSTLTLAAVSFAALMINPHIFEQFVVRSILVIKETEPYPNFGGMLYMVSGWHGLALLPQLTGLIWLPFYWTKRRLSWDWYDQGMMVLLCSVLCSYYSYPYDEILALPALLIAFANGNRRVFVAVFTTTNLGYFVYISGIAGHFGYQYMFLWWTASGWLLTVVLARRQKPNSVLAATGMCSGSF